MVYLVYQVVTNEVLNLLITSMGYLPFVCVLFITIIVILSIGLDKIQDNTLSK